MAILCKKYKLLYIMVGGTGCTSIGKVLRNNFGGVWLPEQSIFHSNDNTLTLDQKHNTLEQLLEFDVITKFEAKQYLKVANVRNPFDVIATKYARLCGPDIERAINKPDSWIFQDKSGNSLPSEAIEKTLKHFKESIQLAREGGFDAWLLKNLGWRSRIKYWVQQTVFQKNTIPFKEKYEMLNDLDEFIRFENLEEDFNQILRKVGIDEYISLPNVNPTTNKKSYKEYYSSKSRTLVETVFRHELERFGYTY